MMSLFRKHHAGLSLRSWGTTIGLIPYLRHFSLFFLVLPIYRPSGTVKTPSSFKWGRDDEPHHNARGSLQLLRCNLQKQLFLSLKLNTKKLHNTILLRAL